MVDTYGYIGIEQLLEYCKNSKDNAITPNDIMRMNRADIVEAVKAMGYGVIPNHNEPLLPCVCGSKRRHNIASFNYVTGEETFALECMKCGRRAEGKSRKQVKHNWNRMIEETGKAE